MLGIERHTNTRTLGVGGALNVSGEYMSSPDCKLTLTNISKLFLICFIGHSHQMSPLLACLLGGTCQMSPLLALTQWWWFIMS